jgi:putative sterol carrier protein
MKRAPSGLFDALAAGEHVPMPNRASGVMRFELVDGKRIERWLIAVDKGTVKVSRGNGAADCVLRADRALFERMAAGKVNAFAATLRGAITVKGDPRLLVLFQRLLPGPRSRRPTHRAADEVRRGR